MTAIPVLKRDRHWVCPNKCGVVALTSKPYAHTEYHNCKALRGLSVPLVEAGTVAKVVVHTREDYEGRDIAQRDAEGNVVMAVSVVKDDGSEDRIVMAPLATVEGMRA